MGVERERERGEIEMSRIVMREGKRDKYGG